MHRRDENGHEDSDVNKILEYPPRVSVDKNFPGSKFLKSSFTFRMMRENKNQDGKRLSFKWRSNYIDKLKDLYETLGSSLEFKDYSTESAGYHLKMIGSIGNYMIKRQNIQKELLKIKLMLVKMHEEIDEMLDQDPDPDQDL